MMSAAATITITTVGTSQLRSVRTKVGGDDPGGVWSTVATGVATVASPGADGVNASDPAGAVPPSAASIAARNSAADAYRADGSRAIARNTTSSSVFETPARTFRGRIGSWCSRAKATAASVSAANGGRPQRVSYSTTPNE